MSLVKVRLATTVAFFAASSALLPACLSAQGVDPQTIEAVEAPLYQRSAPRGGQVSLIESTRFIRADEARVAFDVTGAGGAVAVLDTGVRTSHVDFRGRALPGRNFAGGDPAQYGDGNGHGTNVAGIIAAHGDHEGIAPGAKVVPLKVLRDDGGGSFESVEQALQWVLDHPELNVRVLNLSLGDSGNYEDDAAIAATDQVRIRIAELRKRGIAVVAAAGNDFFRHSSREGMAYPAVLRDTISVGAVYDDDIGPQAYANGARALQTAAGQLTPFSQRLHEATNALARTDAFAPGAPVTASGSIGDRADSTQSGTSQAAPVTAGIVLLLQEYYQRETGKAPSVDQIESWLRVGAPIVDDYGDRDNVTNTGRTFERLDAVRSLCLAQQDVVRAGHAAPAMPICAGS